MLERKIYKRLETFFNEERKSLLVTGARQTGKTFAIRKVGKRCFKHFVEINFVEHPEAIAMFSDATSSREILLKLSLLAGTTLVDGETLIFFDEVQVCPNIITAIKFLVDDGRYRYVMSGSLLGVTLKDIRSVPVGYMDIEQMFPLDLEEFIKALGIGDNVIASLRQSWEERTAVDPFVHQKMMELFRLYIIVGGMPEAVNQYLATNNLQRVVDEQRGIINLYKKDISKYDPTKKLYIEDIFNLIPSELNAKNKRFILKRMNEHFKFERNANSFLWLADAGVALPTYNVEEPRVPLLLSRSRNLFKLFQSDVGLLSSQYADGIQLRIIRGDKGINYGSVYENVVAQELRAHGFDLYYFNSKRQGELDFVVELEGRVLPIEVKSGKDYERHNALSNVMRTADYGIDSALVLCNDNMRVEGQIVYAPIYMVMFMKRHVETNVTYSVDIRGLV